MVCVTPQETERGVASVVEQSWDEGLARAFEFLGKRWNGVILG